ncbi:MAG: ACT domain-containing protein [Eubacteriales bacterium]|nr:ACT domain-containing protein [Eubacteriales bacterium]MDD3882268.1 ACT domain-containing protein [Eubacteriales bacterium]MDD4512014.1 ACT domain-containing protein [Eubacteriales bacterium]
MKTIVSVVGKDQVGIIAKVSQELATLGCNILDISQTLLQDYFTMLMLVDVTGSKLPFMELSSHLKDCGEKMGMEIRIQRTEIFDAMHTI